jgi:hypothetical protein
MSAVDSEVARLVGIGSLLAALHRKADSLEIIVPLRIEQRHLQIAGTA